MKKHLASEVTNLACCWKLKLKSGKIIAFTDFDKNLNINNVTYFASSLFNNSAISASNGLNIENIEIEGILNNDFIKDEELLAGAYDGAEILVFLINYLDLTLDKIILKSGYIGEIKLYKNRYVAEINSLTSKLGQDITSTYSPYCRAKFGDKFCKKNVSNYSYIGKIDKINNEFEFIDFSCMEADAYFDYGLITFISGKNQNQMVQVKNYSKNLFKFCYRLPYELQINDQYQVIAGCNKAYETCLNKFNNVINFRGEPHLPGVEQILSTPYTKK